MDRFAPHAGGNCDRAVAERNEREGHELCRRCDGTGNELYSMYRQCSDCGGTGRLKING